MSSKTEVGVEIGANLHGAIALELGRGGGWTFFFILFYFKGTAYWISQKRCFATTLEPKLVVMCKKN
jgi:hypothetical protein